MICYSINWMGPSSLQWYVDNGFTQRVKIQHPEEYELEVDQITQRWAGGRIDIHGTYDYYPKEIGVPIMREEDWQQFGKWLLELKTPTVLTLKELVDRYEKTNPKIRWWK